jgi:hypothetical protein
MIDAFFCDDDIALGFREDIYTLQDRMRMQRKALGCPLRINAIKFYGVRDIEFHSSDLP